MVAGHVAAATPVAESVEAAAAAAAPRGGRAPAVATCAAASTSAVAPASGTPMAASSSMQHPAQASAAGGAGEDAAPQPCLRRKPRALGRLWASSCALYSDNAGLDSLVMLVGGLSYGGYSLRLAAARAGLMSAGEHAQNASLACILLVLGAFSSRRPSAYRPLAPLLRLGLLCYAFGFPVYASLPAAATFTPPTPCRIPLLGLLVDGYHLWMSTRAAMQLISIIVTRPPLHVAIPLQAVAVWRASHAGYCSMPLLRHATIRQRTDLLHWAMSLLAGSFAFPMSSFMVPEDDTPRCEAALLFCNLILGGLLPLLLLVPLSGGRLQGQGGGGGGNTARPPPAGGPLARLERTLGRALGLFIYEQSPGEGRRTERMPCPPLLALRWMMLVASTWALSCLLYA